MFQVVTFPTATWQRSPASCPPPGCFPNSGTFDRLPYPTPRSTTLHYPRQWPPPGLRLDIASGMSVTYSPGSLARIPLRAGPMAPEGIYELLGVPGAMQKKRPKTMHQVLDRWRQRLLAVPLHLTSYLAPRRKSLRPRKLSRQRYGAAHPLCQDCRRGEHRLLRIGRGPALCVRASNSRPSSVSGKIPEVSPHLTPRATLGPLNRWCGSRTDSDGGWRGQQRRR
jgi:hypothetical protein